MALFIIYLLLVNAASLLLMLADKHRARKNLWRIPERVLFATAACGGSIGCILGMYVVRHKTRHRSFTIGMPVILALQILIFLVIRFHCM